MHFTFYFICISYFDKISYLLSNSIYYQILCHVLKYSDLICQKFHAQKYFYNARKQSNAEIESKFLILIFFTNG